MGVNEYLTVTNEREGKSTLRKHIEDKKTCRILADLIKRVMFCPRGSQLPTFSELEEIIPQINFRKDVQLARPIGKLE
jgi:streptomycin 6-kinase